jgi:hypothetical protein
VLLPASWQERRPLFGRREPCESPGMAESPLRALALFAALVPTAALADMNFYVRNNRADDIAFEFVSRESQTVWPGGDKAYFLEARARKSVRLDCTEGENICYGAWVNGNDQISFGIGPDRDKPCETCCHVCAEEGTQTVDIAE